MTESEYTFFSSFPSPHHVLDFCKPEHDEESCRYLSLTTNGVTCEKAGHLRKQIDKKVNDGTIVAKGDNCEGIIGFITENKDRLIGNRVHYHEAIPKAEFDEVLKDIYVDDNDMVCVSAGRASTGCKEDGCQVDIEQDGIRFSARGLSVFAGESKILFEKA